MFLCSVNCSSSRNAEGIYTAIKKALETNGLQNVLIVAQSYDGAVIMSGHVTGVQQRMKDDHPFAMYVHCMAHKLNLVLMECCKLSRSAMDFLNVVQKLYSVFAEPTKHQMFIDRQTALV